MAAEAATARITHAVLRVGRIKSSSSCWMLPPARSETHRDSAAKTNGKRNVGSFCRGVSSAMLSGAAPILCFLMQNDASARLVGAPAHSARRAGCRLTAAAGRAAMAARDDTQAHDERHHPERSGGAGPRPRSVDRDEVDPSAYVRAIEELSRADGSVGWCVSIANSTGLIAPYLDREVARTIWGDPRATVAWGPPNESRAVAVPGGYRVTGRWDFASGCRHSRWMGAHGVVVEPDGSLRLNNAGRPTLRSWLFPAEEATLLDTWDPIGLRGTASDSYMVSDLFVPEAYSSTREDPSLRRERGRLYAFPQQTMYSVGISSVALGIARGMLDAFMELACRKTPRGM